MILGAGYPKEVQVSVVIFSHLTTAIGFSVSGSAIGKKSQLLKNQSTKCGSGWKNRESSVPLKTLMFN